MYLVFTRVPDESYGRRLGSLLLYSCHVFCWSDYKKSFDSLSTILIRENGVERIGRK